MKKDYTATTPRNGSAQSLRTVRYPLAIGVCALCLGTAHAQQDTTLVRTVVVENEYNPTVMDASKINVLPAIEEPAVPRKDIEYATRLVPLQTWNPENLAPLSRPWTWDTARRGYLRAGYGNYGNADFAAGYVWDPSQQDRLAADLSLTGYNGTLEDWNGEDWKSRFYSTRLRAGYRHRFARHDLSLGGSVASQVYNYRLPLAPSYDYLAETSETTDTQLSDKQHNTLGDVHVGLASRDADQTVQFNAEAGFRYFDRKYTYAAGDEKNFYLKGGVHTSVAEAARLGIDLKLNTYNYSITGYESYTSLELNPHYALENEGWRIRLGIHADWRNGNGSGMDFAPDIRLERTFADSYVFYVRADGGRIINDLRRQTELSPYCIPKAQMEATYLPLDLSAGIKGSPMNGLWFNLFGGYQIRKHEWCISPFPNWRWNFAYNTTERANIAYGGAELKYAYKDVIQLSAKGVYYNWSLKEGPVEETHQGSANTLEESLLALKPELEVDLRADVKYFGALTYTMGYAYTRYTGDLYKGRNDLYIGASYAVNRDLSIFARLNNLLGQQYYLTDGRPAEQLNILGGISLKF